MATMPDTQDQPVVAAPKFPPAKLARAVERVRFGLYRLNQRLVPPQAVMIERILATWESQALHAAAALGIADALAKEPLQLVALATRVGADPDALGRLLRALISRGVFRQRRDGRYELTPLADTLRSDTPVSLAGAALFFGSGQHREEWSLLVESIRTGKPIVAQLRGKEFFDYLADDPAYAQLFNDAMTSISTFAVGPIISGYDFGRYDTVVDVGGGHGGLLAAILAGHPTTGGVLYDLPDVVAGAPKLLEQFGIADRVRVEAGSFFEQVPAGGDAYVLKSIIHDWPDDQALQILHNVQKAANNDARVLLLELVIPEHNREFLGKWTDLEMLLLGGSRERTAAQYRTLLDHAGLTMTRVVQTASPISVVEAIPV